MTNRNLTYTKSRPIQTFVNTCQTKTGSLLSERTYDYLLSGNSPVVDGMLKLRANTLSRKLSQMTDQGISIMGQKGSCSMTWYASNVFPNDYSFANRGAKTLIGVKDATISKWYADLAELKMNAAEIFATRRQTVDLIASNARRLAFLYRSLKRGTNPFRGNMSVNPKNASSLWLEHVYGWQPLVSDVYGAMELQKLDPPPISHKRYKSKDWSLTEKLNSSVAFPGYIRETEWSIFGFCRCTVEAKLTVSDPSVAFARNLGLTNPALLVWELLPYSFVADWFLPIGPWLEAQQALLGLTVRDPSVTTTTKYFASGESRAWGSNAYIKVVGGTGSASLRGSEKSRTLVLPNLPLPKLKNPVSVKHALNAIALLGVQFGR